MKVRPPPRAPLRPAGLLLRAAAGPGLAVAGVAWLLGGLGTFAQAVLTLAVVPDLDLLVRLGGAALLAASGLALPAGALAGLAVGARRLAEGGAWVGLASLGVGGRHLVPGAVAWALLWGAAWAASGHLGEPLARAALRDGRAAAAARVAPAEGRTVALGPWAVAVDDGRLHFAGGDWVGTAERWRLEPALGAAVARLEGVEARSLGGERARAARVVVPIPVDGAPGRPHVSELPTPALRDRIAVSAALGRDAYERWILHKRSLLPVLVLPLVLASLAGGLGGVRPAAPRPGLPGWLAGQALTVWGGMRVCDQAIDDLGPWGATAALSLAVAAWPAWAWARWGER